MNFCSKCGSQLINGKCPNCSKIPQTKKKPKILFIILAILIVIIGGTFIYLKYTTKDANDIANEFSNSISSANADELSNILYCNDENLQINKSNAQILIDYFSKNPSKFSDVNNDFKKGQFTNTGTPLSIEEVRKNFFFFPVYKLTINPSFIKVKTKFKDVKIKVGDKTYGDLTKKNEIGPLMPGEYNITAEISNSYLKKNENINVNTFAKENQDVDVFSKLTTINVTSDIPDAELYINNKDTGIKVKDAKDFGPVDPGSIIYGIGTMDGKKVVSNKYNLNYDNSVYINFEDVKKEEDNFKNDLYSLLSNYSNDFAYAVNNDNFSYVSSYLEENSPIYQKQAKVIPEIYSKDIRESFESTEILNYTFNKDTNTGTVTCNEIYSIAKGYNVPKREQFKNTYTFKKAYDGSLVLYDIKD